MASAGAVATFGRMSFYRKTRLSAMALLVIALDCTGRLLAQDPVAAPPTRFEIEVTTGIGWKVGGGATPLSYTLLPQIITLRIPPISERPWAGGTFMMRSRFSLLLEPIVRGPEHSYLGLAAAGELEWREKSGRFGVFFAAGGGFGWMDSKGYEVPGGQGQDFNLNWLVHTGLVWRAKSPWVGRFGLYFQHVSNRGMDKVNPGLNTLGPTLGLGRRF